MTVECPACGQRMEVIGRMTPCPNCGQIVSATIQTPLPPRPAAAPLLSREETRQVERPAVYRPPEPAVPAPNWLPATLIVLGVFLGIFFLAYLAMMKASSYSVVPPPPPPPAPAPAPPPPPADDERQSKLFSFNNQPPTTAPTAKVAPPAPPVAPTRPVDPLMESAPKPTTAPAPATKPARTNFAVVRAAAPVEEAVTDEQINAAIVK